MIDLRMKLSPNFRLAEFVESETAKQMGITNLPNETELENLRFTAIQMEIVRVICGNRIITATSGFRCALLNEAVEGSNSSDHRLGFALDGKIAGLTGVEIIRTIKNSPLKFDQLIDYGTNRVHFGFGPRMRRQLLKKTSSGYAPLVV